VDLTTRPKFVGLGNFFEIRIFEKGSVSKGERWAPFVQSAAPGGGVRRARGEALGQSGEPSGAWTSSPPLALVSPYVSLRMPTRTCTHSGRVCKHARRSVARAAASPCASLGFRALLHCASSLGLIARADDLRSSHPDNCQMLPCALCSCAPPLLCVTTSGDAPCGQAREEGAAWRGAADHLRSRRHAQQRQGERRCLSPPLSAAGGQGLVPKHRRRRSHSHRGDHRSYAALATRTTRCCRGQRRRGVWRKG